ncbi:beta strand repeat-containing protein [Deinococcus hohokamensis]|uniref:Beta strand repeat-containing protein n=1 Tax=Deinococcus hohokamensis TaxID=309883 RepID=A0ABV9IA90_9DEIO
MKVSTKVFTLMAALAAGSAAAQTTPDRTGNLTNAGATITNTATASYDIPTDAGGTTPGSTNSNTVTTTVAPKMAFDVTYTNGADADGTDTTAGAPAGYQRSNIVPGQTVVFPYVAVNNGNASQTITLGNNATSGVSGIKYFTSNPDTNNDGLVSSAELTAAGNGVTSITVAASGDDPTTTPVESNSGMVSFWMVYTVDSTLGTNVTVGATPVGSGQVWDSSTNANVSATEQKDPAAPSYDDLWWQYNSATTITPSVVTSPPTVPTTVTPPATPTPVPGYPDPTNPGTAIAVAGDEQTAYPKADTNTADDSVTFNNVVNNTSTLSDTVLLTIVANAANQVISGGTNGVYTITQTNANGSTTVATVTLSTTSLTVGANSTASYTVTVSYPDQDGGNPYPISVKVAVDSGNDSDLTPNDYTTDTVLAPAMKFGDATGTTDLVVATGTADAVNKTGAASNTVTFPMEVVNPGEYADTYTLSGYVVVTLTDGTKQIVSVAYSGTGVTKTGTRSVTDSGVTATVDVYTTGAVAANSELAVDAKVTLPGNVAATGGSNYTVKQSAAATYSTIALSDTTDTITVTAAGALSVAKFTQKSGVAAGTETVNTVVNPAGYTSASTSYAPGVNYSYQIIAKNTYNTGVSKFVLKDTTPTNTVYQGASFTLSGFSNTTAKLIYSTDGGTTWSATAPAAGTENVTVAVDLSGDGAITSADVLPSSGQVNLIFTVAIK